MEDQGPAEDGRARSPTRPSSLCRDVGALCRQLLGGAAAVGVLVGGLLVEGREGVEGGEGDGCDDGFDAAALLGLKLCFGLLAAGDQDFPAQVHCNTI
jgi:hypothetical protein